jgi:chaperonin GroEL
VAIQYAKTKSVSKHVITKGPRLERIVTTTMKTISDAVGATLGPGGSQLCLERQEHDMPPIFTKDGVTVFRSLGFDDSTAQVILEAARDAAVRTASSAGDGTTTATVLAESLVRLLFDFTKKNPTVSPQKVVRRLQEVVQLIIEPEIDLCSVKVKWDSGEGNELLFNVAKTSANGDGALAVSVLDCFALVGDDGNVTIAEMSGPSGYSVESIRGFPIAMGYRDSCAKFYQKFMNDPANQRVVLEKPVFLLYHGSITEIQKLVPLMERIGELWQVGGFRHNVIVVATGFSESVLAQLALNFAEQTTINVFPLLVPNNSPIPGAQLEFLNDLACVTGATVCDPLNAPLERVTVDVLGWGGPGENGEAVDGVEVAVFEAYAERSTVVGYKNEDEILLRADQIKANITNAESELERILLQERLGKLTGGIAKLIVSGNSNGELKEKRDRAEDAVCAVRSAIKDGCLPGGGWALLRLMHVLRELHDPIVDAVLIPALFEPVKRLLSNGGLNDHEIMTVLAPVISSVQNREFATAVVYDALERVHVTGPSQGVVDCTPAVKEAIRNSVSIAAQLGTLGGCVVFKRDHELERHEARENNAFVKDLSNTNPADERP